MIITCTNKIAPKLRKHTVDICKYTLDKLLTTRQKTKLNRVSIRVDKSLHAHGADYGAMALAYTDPVYEDSGSPTNFVIWVNPYFTKKVLPKKVRTLFVETIIHETVHVKQALIGQMKQVERRGNMVIKFEKKYYKLDNNNDYWLFPWEVEARGYEKGILNLYCIDRNCFREFPDYTDVM